MKCTSKCPVKRRCDLFSWLHTRCPVVRVMARRPVKCVRHILVHARRRAQFVGLDVLHARFLLSHNTVTIRSVFSTQLGWAGHALRTRPSDTMVQLRQNSPRVVKFLKWRRFEQSSSNLRECTIQVHEQCCDFADLVSFGQTGDVESSASVSVAPSASEVSAGMLRNETHSL